MDKQMTYTELLAHYEYLQQLEAAIKFLGLDEVYEYLDPEKRVVTYKVFKW